MAGEERAHPRPGTLTEQQAERMLADMNEVIRAGEEMRRLRSEMIRMFVGFGWTQDKIARITDMSQPAVSKQVTKYRSEDPLPAPALSLDQHDAPWLEGRLWALAEEVADAFDGARCARCVHALARGRRRFTPRNVDELRRLLEEDLRIHRAEMPDRYRDAYDEISRGLDVPSKASATAAAAASVRRALAHQIQRDVLGDGR
ncbi:sigma-70 family RNA polymerase sigma factor [Streptomyces sp. NPDC023588]|uniref:sigma-70 family RNA polymerase sigma factor n=1 Tax=Streptomyces sp. NPDC023588 TaxID=3154907 RepID=UPI0033F3BFDA